MARPERKNADYFPLWKPQRATVLRIRHYDFKVRLKALRGSSSGFIANLEVREIVFREGGNVCAFCCKRKGLTIDHIVSVYRAAQGVFPVKSLNTRANLQLLCQECNSRKAP
ncbi:HNH endonuclease [Candidatus Pacearchaeota archaeon]|nr:HNH endonuclease [Candidatus Pacearchaeota archaeon]